MFKINFKLNIKIWLEFHQMAKMDSILVLRQLQVEIL
jgi:hypothetical protein